MARNLNYISIIQLDTQAISVLRCRLTGKKTTEHVWLRQVGPWPDQNAMTEALRQFAQENKLQGDRIALVLPRYDVTTRFLTLPSHDMDEIAGMVRFSAEEYVPYSLDEMVIDQCVLNPLDSGESHVLAALAHHEVVEKPLAALQQAGLSPEKVLLSTVCLASAATACKADGMYALVNLTSGGIEITVFEKGLPVFSRGISTVQDWATLCRNPEAGEGKSVLDTGGTEELASELRGSLAAFRRESADGIGVDDIFVACAYADVEKLCQSLAESTGKNCKPAAFALELLEDTDGNLPGIPIEYAGALLDIAGVTQLSVNLLPLRETQARHIQDAKRAALRVSVFLVLILVALGGLYFQAIHQRSKFIGDLERRIALIEPNARGIAEKREALNILSQQVDRKGSILEQLSRIVEAAPEGRVNFSRLDLRRNEGISLWGRAKAVNDVAQYAQNIRSLAESHLAFFAEARSLYEQQTMERDTSVFAYQIDVSAMEEDNDL